MRILGFLLMLVLGCNTSAFTQNWMNRTYRLRAPQDYWHIDTLMFEQDKAKWEIPASLPHRGLFEGTGLQRSGSLVRGISLAGNADASTLSEFNLNLSGELAGGLKLEAQISDKSMPIAPEGTTATLRDFDRIFIRLSGRQFDLQAGDVEITQPREESFLQYRRNTLGLALDVHNSSYTGQHSFGVAKGKFIRKTITVQAGIQGPYRLQDGEQQEQMQVISGSDRVYLNGILLRRGEDADYTLNYSLAQIQFTGRRPIAANDRVEIEFEYTDRTYTRYIMSSRNCWRKEGEKGRSSSFFLNVLSEQDAAASALTGSLSPLAQRQLEAAGDAPGKLWIPAYDSLAYSVNEILYQYVDTVVNGVTYQVFVHSTQAQTAHYRPRFSYMGEGKGNYRQLNTGSNGRTYVWIAPISGIMQGDYDALVPLIAPTQKQIVETGALWERDSTFKTEAAVLLSYYDANTLSDKSDRNAVGWAGRWTGQGQKKVNNTIWKYGWIYWGKNKSFVAADRFVSPEYAMERSLPAGIDFRTFNSVELNTGLQNKQFKALWKIELFEAGQTDSLYAASSDPADNQKAKGALGQWNISWTPGSWDMGTLGKVSPGSTGNSYTQAQAWLIRKTRWARVGFRSQYEQVLRQTSEDRSTQGYETFVSSPDFGQNGVELLSWQLAWSETKETFGITEQKRRDLKGQLAWMKHPEFQTDVLMNYRNLQKPDSISGQQSQLLMNGRIASRLAQGLIQSQLAWGLSNGYEAKTEYYYVFVGAAKGTHAWKDYNGDGVQQLAEFEVAQFTDEAEYVKVFAPSRHYIPVSMQNLSWGLGLQPSMFWTAKEGWQSVLSCFSLQANLVLDRKIRPGASRSDWLDLKNYSMTDTALVSMSRQWSSVLMFQSPDLVWTAECGVRNQSQKYALSDGAEWGDKTTWNLQLAQRFLTQYKWKAGVIHSRQTSISEVYAQKNYGLQEWNALGGLEFHWNNVIRAELNYTGKQKTAQDGQNERATQHRLEIKPSYYFPDQGVLQLSTTFVYIRYPFPQGTALSYEMLDGLKAGKNLQWEARFARKVWGGMEAEVLYNGRRLSGGKILHAGTVSMRMNF